MKNPNGYGTIRKLSGNRRKPWAVLAPQSSSEYSLDKQRKLIGCYATRAEAMTALGAWHKTPHLDVPATAENITLAQLCAEYKKLQKFKNLSKQTQNNYSAAWNKLAVLGSYKVKDLRAAHFQTVVDTAHQNGLSASSLQKIKLFASLLCDYAVQNDIVIKNYATFVTLPKAETKEKVPFSDLDLQRIDAAAKAGIMYADLILIMCYTGWRINEFLALTPFSWNSTNHTLRGGEKTEAGKNRVVPVSDKIMPYLQKWLDKNGPTIICESKEIISFRLPQNIFARNGIIRHWKLSASRVSHLMPQGTLLLLCYTATAQINGIFSDSWDILQKLSLIRSILMSI